MCNISVIVPTYNEINHISSCLDSIILQDYPKEKMEVLVIDGMSIDGTRRIIKGYTARYPFIRLLDNPFRIIPHALNLGIISSKGDVIIRIDAHSKYPGNYISILVGKLSDLQADNVGGLWRTNPSNDSETALAIAIAASHPFGVGNSLHKIGVKKITRTDTVPYGCYNRSVFDNYGLFDTDLLTNEDNEFNGRIVNGGGKIYLIPEIIIDYYSRDKLSKTARMFYQYGLFKPLVNKKLRKPITIRQFFPPVFLMGLMIGGILSFFSGPILLIFLGTMAIYVLSSLTFSMIEAFKRNNNALFFLLPVVFLVIHLSYGWGYLAGTVKFLILKRKTVKIGITR
jgi:glycosyltransferase involved in cell wall biosynthesis